MGCVAAIDMGLVILRCAIFDRHNMLFPAKMGRDKQTFFNPALSFYSVEHGGTFHFLQFNVLQADEFMKSAEYSYLVQFLQKSFPSHVETLADP